MQGAEGVEQVLQILRDEFDTAMALSGQQSTSSYNCINLEPIEILSYTQYILL